MTLDTLGGVFGIGSASATLNGPVCQVKTQPDTFFLTYSAKPVKTGKTGPWTRRQRPLILHAGEGWRDGTMKPRQALHAAALATIACLATLYVVPARHALALLCFFDFAIFMVYAGMQKGR
jgi:hypothetical protein